MSDQSQPQIMLPQNPHASCIHQMFEAQVRQSPNAIAVEFEGRSLTYAELNCRANQFAYYLQRLGVTPDCCVGVYMERSPELIVTLLAIFKAGGTYVPLDLTYPVSRLMTMIETAQVSLVISQTAVSDRLPNHQPVVRFEAVESMVAQYETTNLCSTATLDSLAYVIYTSGSSGVPKGVAMPHRSLTNLVRWQISHSAIPNGRTLQFAAIGFDVALQEICSTLAAGGTLVLITHERRRDLFSLLRWLDEAAIERIFLPFVALQQLASIIQCKGIIPQHLREVITAGEQLRITPAIAHWFAHAPECLLHNHYGPSESHVVTAFTLTGSTNQAALLPPIGRPIANVEIVLLDEQLQPVPAGSVGELYIGGACLARGYINQPELTAERFIPHPLKPSAEARLYKTGDLARYLPDGNLEYLGRTDQQIKIRGFRIEPGEVETALEQHDQVKEAVVVAREDDTGNQRLVAYVVSTNAADPALTLTHLRNQLKTRLPEYMVPSAIVVLDHLPLTPNGKVDRQALPKPSPIRPVLREQCVLPRSPVECTLATIWAQVLDVDPIGIHDHFFDLGGDSLKAIQCIQRVQEQFSIEMPMVALFDAPTVAQFAELIGRSTASGVAQTTDHMTIEELCQEATLAPDIRVSDRAQPESMRQPAIALNAVLMTGATGFLGAFLLHELLQQTQATIYCLVRSTSLDAAQRKIQANLACYLLWRDDYTNRIVPVIGDLSRPKLGLTQHQFQELAQTVEAIYHNGASINLIYPYSALRDANVSGTEELLRLAVEGQVKPVHFISTLDVFQTGGAFSRQIITEQDHLNPRHAIHFDGYTKSKWVSEQMVSIAGIRGVPVSIYRPAMIVGHSQTGVANTNDLMNRLIKGFIQLGVAPNFDMMINIAPVDYFSKGMVHLSLLPACAGYAFNFINPNPVPMREFIDIINMCGNPVQIVEHQQWERALLQNLGRIDEIVSVLTSKPSKHSLSYLERSSVGANRVSCQNVLDGLQGSGLSCPSINDQLMRRYITYFTRVGFLSPTVPRAIASPFMPTGSSRQVGYG